MSAYNDDDHKDAPYPSMGIMQPDETPVWPLSRLLFAGGIVSVILMTWLAALYYQYNSHLAVKKDIPAKDMMGATKTIGLVRTEAQQALNAQPHVADPATGRIAIPIALAEQKVLAELKANPEADVTGPAPPAPAEAEAAADSNPQEASPSAEEMKAEENKPEEPAATPEDEGDQKPADEEPAEEKDAEKKSTEEKPKEETSGEKDDAEKQPAEEPESSSEEPKEDTASPKDEGDESTAEEDTSTEPEANSDE